MDVVCAHHKIINALTTVTKGRGVYLTGPSLGRDHWEISEKIKKYLLATPMRKGQPALKRMWPVPPQP